MVSLTLIIGCVIGGLLLAALAVGLAMLMNSSDPVSSAREGWIHRRSEKDEEGW